jgi:hypothetical protein
LAKRAPTGRRARDSRRDSHAANAEQAVAPWDWCYAFIPLDGPDEEIVDVETAVARMLTAFGRIRPGDTSALGPVMHVAHILQSEQGADGRWPARLNVRTGEAVGSARTGAPATLLRRLDSYLNLSEFESCYSRVPEGDRAQIAETNPD